MVKNIGKNVIKSLNSKDNQKLIDHANMRQMRLKLLQKESFKKQRRKPGI